ncbi:MAG: hypothetical protein KDK44_01725 [Chlamydiia bacterium]|nr:hypothetical protein [Chlamydiia bacterium]
MLKSQQTGFIHYNYHSKDGVHDTIPVVENACHILELLRTKQADKLYEAKFLLEKLLAFQTSSGNFPQYLHEYPSCYNWAVAFDLLAPFVHIKKEFQTILPPTLTQAIQRLQVFCQSIPHAENHHKILLQAALGEPIECLEAKTATAWSNLLIARSMSNQDLPLDHLAKRWHGPSKTFIGLSELQDGKLPAPTLLDLFMGQDLQNHPLILKKALTRPIDLTLHNNSSLDYLSTYTPQPFQKDFHLMRWDGLACQNSQHHVVCRNALEMDFTYPEKLPDKDERYTEIEFFYPHDGIPWPATTFQLGCPLKVGPFTLTFLLLEGQGHFYGHISRGNRPSQIRKDMAYDWQIGLRTVKRSPNLKLRVIIQRADSSAESSDPE